jgi:drug/metabolite transporter (DMT)-like permease
VSWDVTLVVLFGAALHAAWNALVRAGSDPVRGTAIVVFGAAVAAAPVLVLLPVPAPASWPYLAASAAVHVVYFVLVALAYKAGDLSLVYPLMRGGAPLMTALAATSLGEPLTGWGWAGVVLIGGGVLLMACDTRAGRGGGPRPVLLALLTAGVVSLYTVVDGLGARSSGSPLSYTGWMLVFTALALLPVVRATAPVTATPPVRGRQRWGVVGGACTFGSYAIALWAMTRAPIPLVAALRETSVVFATLIAVLLLRERVSRVRWAAVGVIAAGTVAIKLS